jgi:lipopolysaccharide export system permease protein
MRLSYTLSVYLARQFLFWMIGVLVVFALTAFVFDTIELLRRAAGKPQTTIDIIIKMALLKLPHLTQEMFPFVILSAAMMTFWRLTRSHELTVARASGVSVWQFLLPAVAIALVLGALKIAVFNPMTAAFYANFERLEAAFLRGRASLLAVSSTGFWLREFDGNSNAVVHALRVSSQDLELFEVIIFNFAERDRFLSRIDAASARLEPGAWHLRQAWTSIPGQPSRFAGELRLPTELTIERIQESFASPETISFWELPQFIAMLENAGFSAKRHRMHLHRLLSTPLVLCSMVLIAATFALRPPRRGGGPALVAAGIATGFVFYFLNNLVSALGEGANLPVVLAAWVPGGVSALAGVSMLLHLEDG